MALYSFADYLLYLYQSKLPPAILGILALLGLLIVLKCVPRPIAIASKPLLNHMSLFFIPAIVAIVDYSDLIRAFPIALLLAIIFCTLLSLVLTAWLAQKLMAQPLSNENK